MKALLPLSWAYGAGLALHRSARRVGPPVHPSPRIISVGNLEAGGNGKTPLAIWLVERAVAEGISCAYVSRGYGGAVSSDVVTCVLAGHVAPPSLAGMRVLSHLYPDLASEIGDEGALVVERAPGVTALFCRDKLRAVDAATQLGVARVFLDDAFQSWRVARHADIVLLDAQAPLDGGQLLPAGRLREKPDALRRADAIVFNGAATSAAVAAGRAAVERWLRPGARVAGMERRIEVKPATDAARGLNGPFLAVSAIARPAAFEQALRSTGVTIAGHEVFSDHHRYDIGDIERIAARARSARVSAIVTTEKDWVKLRRFEMPVPVWVARLDVSLIGDELPV